MKQLNIHFKMSRYLSFIPFVIFIFVFRVNAQVQTQSFHLEKQEGFPTYEFDTGWQGGSILGIGGYVYFGASIGGTLAHIRINGHVTSDYQNPYTFISFYGDSANAYMQLGFTSTAKYKLKVPDIGFGDLGGNYIGDIPLLNVDLALNDNKNFTPLKLKNSFNLYDEWPQDIPIVAYEKSFGKKKIVSIEVGLTLGAGMTNKITDNYMSTSLGYIYKSGTGVAKLVDSDPYVISDIKEHMASDIYLNLIPKITFSVTVWGVGGEITIPIVNYPIKLSEDNFVTSSASVSFSAQPVTLSVAQNGKGTGTVKINSVQQNLPFGPETLTPGTQVTLEADPANNSQFSGWGGIYLANGQNQNPVTITMVANENITANFGNNYAKDTVKFMAVSASTLGKIKVNGTVHDMPYTGVFNAGSQVGIEAIPYNGSCDEFTSWSGAIGGSDNPKILIIGNSTGHQYIYAQFSTAIYHLKFEKGGNGNGVISIGFGNPKTLPFDTTLLCGKVITVQAIPASNSVFTGFTGDATSKYDIIYNLHMNKDKNITVNYANATKHKLTFYVDMGVYMKLQNDGFNPATDSLVLRGDFEHFFGEKDWSGNNYLLTKNINYNTVYSKSIDFPDSAVGTKISFHYIILHNGKEIWENRAGFRTYTLNSDANQYTSTVYFDDRTAVGTDAKITFIAEMSNLLSTGFDNDNNFIGVRGNLYPLNWNYSALMQQETANPNLYKITMQLNGTPGSKVQWSLHCDPESLFVNNGWGIIYNNRSFTFPQSDTTIGPLMPIIEKIGQVQNAGNVKLALEYNSTLGTFGIGDSSLFWPAANGSDYLSLGGLWIGGKVGRDVRVMNADYYGPPDWFQTAGSKISSVPGISSQDISFTYDDSLAGSTPLGLRVLQKSYEWASSGANDFIILTYNIQNRGINASINNILAGLWLDADVPPDPTKNVTGYDASRNMIYMSSSSQSGGYVGLRLLGNNNPHTAYSYKYGGDPQTDTARWTMLNEGIAAAGTQAGDYRMLEAANPFSLSSGQHRVISFGIVLGNGLTYLQTHADSMEALYERMIVTTGVKQEQTDQSSMAFRLSQNYPNPFNPSTTIQYKIPAASHVSLNIYNMLGEVVDKLVNKNQNAGTYSVQWKPDLPSGIYFYKLIANVAGGSQSKSFVETKKLILLK